MTYSDLIKTISAIVENNDIIKVGLTIEYELSSLEVDDINEKLYKINNPYSNDFTPTDSFEVFIGGILIKFKKKI